MRSFNDVFGVLAQGYATALGLTAQRPLPAGHPATAELAALRGLRSTGGAWDPPALGRTAAAMEHAVLLCHAAGIPLGLGRRGGGSSGSFWATRPAPRWGAAARGLQWGRCARLASPGSGPGTVP